MLDLTCKAVAAMIKGKTPEEIRQQFNIKNDFTPAEEEQVFFSFIYLFYVLRYYIKKDSHDNLGTKGECLV